MAGLVICAWCIFFPFKIIIKKIQHISKCLQYGSRFMQVMFAFSNWCGSSPICNMAFFILFYLIALGYIPSAKWSFFSPSYVCPIWTIWCFLFSYCQFLIRSKHVVEFRIRHAVYLNQLWILVFDLNNSLFFQLFWVESLTTLTTIFIRKGSMKNELKGSNLGQSKHQSILCN